MELLLAIGPEMRVINRFRSPSGRLVAAQFKGGPKEEVWHPYFGWWNFWFRIIKHPDL